MNKAVLACWEREPLELRELLHSQNNVTLLNENNITVHINHSALFKNVTLVYITFTCSVFSRPKWISVAKSAKLLKGATEMLDPKKHHSLLVAIWDQKNANRIPQRKVGVSKGYWVQTVVGIHEY